MKSDVYWMLELEIQSGKDSEFRTLMAEMVRAAQENEPGTLVYDWSTSADGKLCHILEGYVDSAALLAHLATFGEKFAGRFLDVLKPVRFVVYGAPSKAAQDALAGFGPVYMQRLAGFSR